jgi:hypothetical protein
MCGPSTRESAGQPLSKEVVNCYVWTLGYSTCTFEQCTGSAGALRRNVVMMEIDDTDMTCS